MDVPPTRTLAEQLQILPQELFDKIYDYTWQLPEDTDIVVDESYRLPSTLHSDLSIERRVVYLTTNRFRFRALSPSSKLFYNFVTLQERGLGSNILLWRVVNIDDCPVRAPNPWDDPDRACSCEGFGIFPREQVGGHLRYVLRWEHMTVDRVELRGIADGEVFNRVPLHIRCKNLSAT